jgi:hypothetical protein
MKFEHFLESYWFMIDDLTNFSCLDIVFGESTIVITKPKWRRHIMLPIQRMKLEEWMSDWELKDQTPMGMEKR